MSFNIGDRVVHRSDGKKRKMVVAGIAVKNMQPQTIHEEFANIGRVQDGSYYCTWISGAKKGEGYFVEQELDIE